MAQGAHDPNVERWRPIVERYFRSADVDYAMMVMWGESQGDPAKTNDTAGLVGLFQLPLSIWPDRIRKVRTFWANRGVEVPYNIWDPEAQIATASWIVGHAVGDPKLGGWGAWPSARRYFQPGSWKQGQTYWDGFKYVNTGMESKGYAPQGQGKAAGTPGGMVTTPVAAGSGFSNPVPSAPTPGAGGLFGVQREHGPHAGIDLTAPLGTPILAMQAGVVVSSGYRNERGGRGVVLRHPNGWTTHYYHCQSENVREGDQVQAGQMIALVGQTGNAVGPHLHLEVRNNGTPVDPLSLKMTAAPDMPEVYTAAQARQVSPMVEATLGVQGLYEPQATTQSRGHGTFAGIVEALSNSAAGGQRQPLSAILGQPEIGEIVRPGLVREQMVEEEPA